MVKHVKLRRSSVKGKKPNPTADLEHGDLALNFNHESATIFARADDDSLLEWHAGGFSLPLGTNAGEVLTVGTGAAKAPIFAPLPAATATAKGIVQLADTAAITAGTVGRVVDAAQLKAAYLAKNIALLPKLP